ncbi:MAG: Fe(3+) ABC transporter substrate-binding protein [Parvibaculum sp.]
MFSKRSIGFLAAFLGLSVISGTGQAAEELNIYSARHYDTDLSIYERFTADTGIKINLVEGESEELLARIAQEGEFSPGDVLLTVDAGRLWQAEQSNAFQPFTSDVIEARVPAHLRHPDNLWFGISKRARVFVYNKEDGAPTGLTTYAALANPALGQSICVRSSSSIYNISLLAAIISHEGTDAAQSWADGVVKNFQRAPQGNDTAQIEAVAAGECRFGIANTYYLGRLLGSASADERALANKVGIVFPDQDGRGTHINISGAGLLTHAPNKDNAIKFLEFLTSEWAQKILAEGNNEYPIVVDVATDGPIASFGTFKEDEVNASELGRNQALAIRIFDRAGWR